MLMPKAASGPLSAPAIAMDTGGQVALPSPAGSAGVAPAAALTSVPFSSIWTCSTIFRSAFDVLCSGEDWLHPAMPSTSRPAPPSANAFRATRLRTLHLRVMDSNGIDDEPQVGRSLMPRVDTSQPVAGLRDVERLPAARRYRELVSRRTGNAVLTQAVHRDQAEDDSPLGGSSVSRTTSATRFMVVRRSIAARWIHLNASGSVMP